MSLLLASALTVNDLATRLSMDVEDDSDGLTFALEAACSDIEPYVIDYTLLIGTPFPVGLKLAILDIAATRYQRMNLSDAERIGQVQTSYTNEYSNMMERIAPYRNWAGL